jgi:hypothetical protein
MAVNWSVCVNGTPPHNIQKAMDQLLRHVLSAAMSCEEPTTQNIATTAEISPDCCETVLQVAQALGLMNFEPAACAS